MLFNHGNSCIPIYYVDEMVFVSLGQYIILCNKDKSVRSKLHEYGHTKQSLMLGWLYLIIIGLPSITCAIYSNLFHSKWTKEQRDKWYFSLLWEKWADNLGGVKR